MPRVSVIILTRNRAHMLPTAIDSVLAQTYRDIELVIVDDASTDHTPDVVARYAERVRYVRKPVNEGEAAGRNTGLHASTGDFIAFLDDDDYYFPDKIALQVRMLDARPDIGLAYCRFVYADAQGKPVWQSGVLPEGHVLADLVSFCFVLSHAPLTRRSCFARVGDFDTTLPSSPDWDMWLRMAQAGIRFGCVQRPLVAYRQHGANITKGVDRWRAAHTLILDRIFGNADLPASIVAQRSKAYASSRASSAMAYYGAEELDKARTDMAEAISYDPALATPDALAQTITDGIVNLNELIDPRPALDRVLDHLPDDIKSTRVLRSAVTFRACINYALRLFAAGRVSESNKVLIDAVESCLHDQLAAADVNIAAKLCEQISSFALSQPNQPPVQFVVAWFNALPGALQRTQVNTLRSTVVADVAFAEAFTAHAAGEGARVRHAVTVAVRHRPRLVLNRGVWSIWLRSFL
jgi:GT2 family glycosyltransferase